MKATQLAQHAGENGMVPLKFNGRYTNINAGEIAGYDPKTAEALTNHMIPHKELGEQALAELYVPVKTEARK